MEIIAGMVAVIGFLLMIFIIYFLPSIIAIKRNHKNIAAIFLINLFLGWSGVGWLAALIWSVID